MTELLGAGVPAAPGGGRRAATVAGVGWPFAESAGRMLVDIGVPAADARVERFGPSGPPA